MSPVRPSVPSKPAPLQRPAALSEQVYDRLRELMRAGKLRPEQALREAALAAELGVSRTPVREALTRLASEGLLQGEGRSFTVPAPDAADIDDLFELRRLLEPEAMRQAALAWKPAGGAALKRALADAADAERAGDAGAFAAANAAFRTAWLALVGNRRLVHALQVYSDHVVTLRQATLSDASVRKTVLRGMKSLAAAMARNDGEAAAKAMRAHLQEAERALRAALRETDIHENEPRES